MSQPSMIPTVTGAGTVLPARVRSSSCHPLEIGGRRHIFNLGPGALGRPGLHGGGCRQIATPFISHLRATEGHRTVITSARIARNANVRHLALTHIYRAVEHDLVPEQASAMFGGEMAVTADRMVATC